MISTEQGVYLQFFDEGEPPERELPPLGPFELLIIRHNRIIGDREAVEHDMLGVGSVERWLEAELELRRALGDEPGGMRRSHMRIRAPRGDIIVRFYDYAGDEPPKVPELGPFYALVVGKREVRADDKLIAIRSTDMSPWTMTDAIRPGIAGINKADFSLFSLSAREPRQAASTDPQLESPAAPEASPYVAPPVIAAPPTAQPAPPLQSAPPVDEAPAAPTEFVERRKVQREIYQARPLPPSDEQLTPADVNLILRVDKLKQQELAQQLMVERLRREQRVDPEIALRSAAVDSLPMRFQPPVKERVAAAETEAPDEYEEEPLGQRLLGLLWRARLVLITLLILVAAVSAVGYLRTSSTPAGPPPLTYASVGQKIQSADWTIAIDSVERTLQLGQVRPRAGSLLLVHVTATKKNGDAPNLDPNDFVLVDAAGARIPAFAPTSDIYASGTGLAWPTRFSVSAPTRVIVVFDVNPGAKGLSLLIKSSNVLVRLPDP